MHVFVALKAGEICDPLPGMAPYNVYLTYIVIKIDFGRVLPVICLWARSSQLADDAMLHLQMNVI